ncbi:Small auxin-up RNA [Trema orientale]|uniref:Small auxin-up RNA n=1 Tax=Trema orientale TaxID=63057 RepID=A0A2P5B4D7_TREOI|nr:Small auxin-up RNA [Trema orientale]
MSTIKRWPSLTKFSHNNSNISSSDHQSGSNKVSSNNLVEEDYLLHAVYVGKARRRYLVSSEVVEHPLFQKLVYKFGGGDENDGN